MLRIHDKQRYKLWFQKRQNELFSPDDCYYWVSDPTPNLFRNRTWRTALLGGDPHNYSPTTIADRVACAKSDGEQPGDAANGDRYGLHQQHTHDRFWRPWEYVLRSRDEYLLIFSTYETSGDASFSADRPCAADCALDWKEIASVPGVLPDVNIVHRCTIFGASADWALYCCESCSVLGGAPEFMAQYGEAAGGWPALKTRFLEFLNTEPDFTCNPPYKAAVERTCELPIMAWS